MSNRMIATLTGTLLISAPVAAAATSPLPTSGTICVTIAGSADGDPLAKISAEAVLKALGARGFTILDDSAHAAFEAETLVTRTEVGTSVSQGRPATPSAAGGGVNIPLSRAKSVFVPLQRVRMEIRIRRRGSRTILWHGAAVTVRSISAQGSDADRVAFALGQAALSSYPTQTAETITIP